MRIFYALNFVVCFSVFIFASKLHNQTLLTTKHIKIMAQFKVHNLIIVDASGSMTPIYEQALAGINVLSFASGGEPLQYAYRNTIAEQTTPLTPNDYTLRGMTALYDAIGTSVTDLERNKGKEDKVLVTIITDGYENDSIEWDGASVKKLIDRLCKKGWVFTYIGANQDAALEAGKIGVKNSLTFEASIEGTVNMFAFEKQSRQRWNKRVRLNENDIQNDYFSDDDK